MRPIDADALKEWVENWFVMNRYYHPYAKKNNIPIGELYDILDRLPTIDAEGVIHSAPNCGAKMDVADKDVGKMERSEE